MDGNPYKSPQFLGRAETRRANWPPLAWGVVGFAGGIVIGVPVGAMDMPSRLLISVGIVRAIWGLAYGIKRNR